MNDALWSAYLETRVDIQVDSSSTITVQSTDSLECGDWPFAAKEVWIITAHNPRSIALDERENAVRHEALRSRLTEAGFSNCPATGYSVDGSGWSEPGFAVFDAPKLRIVELAEEFEQNAVFRWCPESWSIVGVLVEGNAERGWRVHR